MTEEASSARPTAGNLKSELRESLELLKKDFENLKHFVDQIAPEGVPAQIPLLSEDRQDLLEAASEIHDAADDVVFEAGKIKEKLERLD